MRHYECVAPPIYGSVFALGTEWGVDGSQKRTCDEHQIMFNIVTSQKLNEKKWNRQTTHRHHVTCSARSDYQNEFLSSRFSITDVCKRNFIRTNFRSAKIWMLWMRWTAVVPVVCNNIIIFGIDILSVILSALRKLPITFRLNVEIVLFYFQFYPFGQSWATPTPPPPPSTTSSLLHFVYFAYFIRFHCFVTDQRVVAFCPLVRCVCSVHCFLETN